MLLEHVRRAFRIPASMDAYIDIYFPQRNMEAREKMSELEENVLLAKEAHAAEVQDLQEERRELFKAADEAQQQMKQVWSLAVHFVNSPCVYSCSYQEYDKGSQARHDSLVLEVCSPFAEFSHTVHLSPLRNCCRPKRTYGVSSLSTSHISSECRRTCNAHFFSHSPHLLL
jgi:hypothetical protein